MCLANGESNREGVTGGVGALCPAVNAACRTDVLDRGRAEVAESNDEPIEVGE